MPKQKAFDGPVKIITHLDLASLRMLLAHKAPLGKTRLRTSFNVARRSGKRVTYTYKNAPPPHGRLRQSFLKKGAVRLSASGKTVLITSDLPYARAVDQGRKAIDITPKNAQYLMFAAGGKVIFTKKVHQPARKGQYFVKAAAMEWWSRRGKEISVRWAKHEGEPAVQTADTGSWARGGD